MGKAGRQVVGIFNAIIGIVYLVSAFTLQSFIWMFYDMIDNIPGGGVIGDIVFGIIGLDITVLMLLLVGIFWLVLAVGLFMDKEWAVVLTKILAILTLIGSIFTCNCIGIILAIIILYLVKSDKAITPKVEVHHVQKSGDSDRRCPNCGRVIPHDAVVCPYCGKKFDLNLKDASGDDKKKETKKDTSEMKKDSVDERKNEKGDARKVKYCPECGTKLDGGQKYCPECGTKIR